MSILNEAPNSPEIEKTILCSLMQSPTLKETVFTLLKPGDFHHSAYAEIYRTMMQENSCEESLLRAILVNQFPRIDEVFGELSGTASSVNLTKHIEILQNLSKRRQLIKSTGQAERSLYDIDAPLDETIGQLQAVFAGQKTEIAPVWQREDVRNVIANMINTEPKPFEFIVPGLLAKGLCGFLYGEGGGFKSLAALWLCLQRACGEVANSKWLDKFEIANAGRSMFCSAEDETDDFHHRIRSILPKLYDLCPNTPRQVINDAINDNFHLLPREVWMNDGMQHIVDANGNPTLKNDRIAAYAKQQGIDLIIFDTLSRISMTEENDNNGGARLVSALEKLRDITGATVLCIAHSGKGNRTAQTDTHGQNGLRGASALMDNARFGLWFKAVDSNKGNPKIDIINAKTFRARRVEPFKVEIDYPAFVMCTDDDVSTENDLMDAVIADVRANPGTTQRGTRKRLKKSMNFVKLGFDDAVEARLISHQGKGKGYIANE